MIQYLGLSNFQGLNIYTFQNPPRFMDGIHAKTCTTTAQSNLFFANYFDKGDFYQSLAQILQWYHYVFYKDPAEMHSFLKITEILKNQDGSVVRKITFGSRKELLLVQKTTTKNDSMALMNEYFIGQYCTNHLRCFLPHFTFYYYCDNGKRLSISQEYVSNATSIQEFLKTSLYLDPLDFLSVFFQTLLALEFAQNYCFFSHNDLHGENLLLRPNTLWCKDVCISIYGQVYTFPSPRYIPTIIDLGYSTGFFDSEKLLSHTDLFPQYGYFPFPISGTDMFKMIMTCYSILKNRKEVSFQRGFRFCEFILRDFMGFKTNVLAKELHLLSRNYYNLSVYRFIYSTPHELFNFLESNKNKVCGIFGIADYPFYRMDKRASFPSKVEAQFCNMFCLKSISKDCLSKNGASRKLARHVPPFTPEEDVRFSKIEHIPLLHFANEKIVEEFLRKYHSFLGYYDYHYYYIFEAKASPNVFFIQHFVEFTKFYRCLKTLQCYLEYLKKVEKNKRQLTAFVKSYLKKLSILRQPMSV